MLGSALTYDDELDGDSVAGIDIFCRPDIPVRSFPEALNLEESYVQMSTLCKLDRLFFRQIGCAHLSCIVKQRCVVGSVGLSFVPVDSEVEKLAPCSAEPESCIDFLIYKYMAWRAYVQEDLSVNV